jgi:hypothetical protein
MPMIVRDSIPPCPCSLCQTLGTLIDAHRAALHRAELTRQAVEQAARQCDRRHHLPSAIGDDAGDWRPRLPSSGLADWSRPTRPATEARGERRQQARAACPDNHDPPPALDA